MSGKTMADVLGEHQRKTGIRDMRQHCVCGWSGGQAANDFIPHQAEMLAAAGFGPVAADTTTEWGVRRDADSAVHSRERAQRTIEIQRKRKLRSVLIRRQVGPWELAEP